MIRPIPLVLTGCVLVALSARHALAYEALIEAHAAATYPYILGKGEAAGRSALAAAGGNGPSYPQATKAKLAFEARSAAASCDQGANRLAQWPACACAGESAIEPPRGTH